jgi:small glutamine-rich tetratricopeptide repeat-containing protein alpha
LFTQFITHALGLEKKFQEYFQLLVERKYFANAEEGSDEYKKRLQTARERFFAKFQKPVDPITTMTKEQRNEEAEKHKNKANDLLRDRKWQEAIDEYTVALKYSENAVIFANRAVPYGKLHFLIFNYFNSFSDNSLELLLILISNNLNLIFN